MKDQLAHWNNAHAEQWLHKHSTEKTTYAEEINDQMSVNSTVLELGCGEGNDSIYFAEQGHIVSATDFSDIAIGQNKKRWMHSNLTFKVQDIRQPFQFDDASFDIVYARLSLHYFTDETTKNIFREIARVLRPGGILCFMCKSTDDHIYGQGEKIENDMYERDGHVRHFFSKKYVLELLDEVKLHKESIQTGEEMIYDRQSAFIKVVAKKPVS
jgi:ubiquinone/menaquinone biosynthesis C-methylase UbiE